jgi:hypothetical protein
MNMTRNSRERTFNECMIAVVVGVGLEYMTKIRRSKRYNTMKNCTIFGIKNIKN